MSDYSTRVVRNLGFVGPREQERLRAATVAVAGAGGDGGQAALALARMGIGAFHIADPEPFEWENVNRQAAANADTVGRNKASVIGEQIERINPDARVTVLPEGVTPENLDRFLDGADVVVDETDYTRPDLGLLLAQGSRRRGLPVVLGLNVGFGSLVTTFAPDGMTFEEYLGISPTDQRVPLSRWVSRIPSYTHRSTFAAVATEEIAAPSVAPGVHLAAAFIATAVFELLSGRRRPVTAPRCVWCDAYERRCRVIRWRGLSAKVSLARMAARANRTNPPE